MDMLANLAARSAVIELHSFASILDSKPNHPDDEQFILDDCKIITIASTIVIDDQDSSITNKNEGFVDMSSEKTKEEENVTSKLDRSELKTSTVTRGKRKKDSLSNPKTSKSAKQTLLAKTTTGFEDEYAMEVPSLFKEMERLWLDLPSNPHNELLDKGPFDKEHLRYCNLIHALYQSLYETQLALVQDLYGVPHGQFAKGKHPLPDTGVTTKEYFPLFGKIPRQPDAFTFLKTCQIADDNIPWLEAFNCVVATKSKKVGITMDQQNLFINIGYTSGHSTTHRQPSDLGVTCPSLLHDTLDPFMTDLLVTVTSVLTKTIPSIWEGLPQEQMEKFAKSIHADNNIEYMRIAITNVDSKTSSGHCHFHNDVKNNC